jgi:hypothetical protein
VAWILFHDLEPRMVKKWKRRKDGDYTVIAIVAVAVVLFVLLFFGLR